MRRKLIELFRKEFIRILIFLFLVALEYVTYFGLNESHLTLLQQPHNTEGNSQAHDEFSTDRNDIAWAKIQEKTVYTQLYETYFSTTLETELNEELTK